MVAFLVAFIVLSSPCRVVEVTAGELDDESVPSFLRNIVDNADAMLRFFIRAFRIDDDSLMVSASHRAMWEHWILLCSSDQTIPPHSRTRGLFRALDRARAGTLNSLRSHALHLGLPIVTPSLPTTSLGRSARTNARPTRAAHMRAWVARGASEPTANIAYRA